jgi:hypothetical protein
MNFKAFLGPCRSNQVDHRLDRLNGNALPIAVNVAEKLMLYFVSRADAWWWLETEFDRQSCVIIKPLQSPSPKVGARTVTATGVRLNQYPSRTGIPLSSQKRPPSTNRGHGKLSCAVADHHGHAGFIMSRILQFPQSFLLRLVHENHRRPSTLEGIDTSTDVLELRFRIRILLAFNRYVIGLQAVAARTTLAARRVSARRVSPTRQLLGDGSRPLATPKKRRHWVSSRTQADHLLLRTDVSRGSSSSRRFQPSPGRRWPLVTAASESSSFFIRLRIVRSDMPVAAVTAATPPHRASAAPNCLRKCSSRSATIAEFFSRFQSIICAFRMAESDPFVNAVFGKSLLSC